MVEVATRKVRAFSGKNTGTNDQPRWSPDSQQLAFVSNRVNRDEKQLYLIDIDGGEAQALTDLRGCVDAPHWSADGCSIAFLYSGTLDPESSPDPDPVVVDANPPFNRVWILECESRRLQAVTPEVCHVFEYDWLPDGKMLAVLTSPHPNPGEGWYSAQLHTVDLASGAVRQVCTIPQQIGRLSWSPDSTSIAFVSGVMSDEGNVAGEVYIVSAAGGAARSITPEIDYSITWIDWLDEGILYGGRQIELAVAGWIDPQSGEQRLLSKGAYSINGWGPQRLHAARNGTFAALHESFSEPPNVHSGSLANGEWRRLTDLPYDEANFPPLRVENKYWVGADGMPVQGYLVYPPGYVAGKRYPLFAHVHGGPSWSYVPRYVNPWERLLTGRGCLVLMPNPRGSWGRGNTFQAANVAISAAVTGRTSTRGSTVSSRKAWLTRNNWRLVAGATAAI